MERTIRKKISKREDAEGEKRVVQEGRWEEENKRREGWVKGKEQTVEGKIKEEDIRRKRGKDGGKAHEGGREEYFNGGCLAGSVVG